METLPLTGISRATIMELGDGFRGFYISKFVSVGIAGAMISIFFFGRRFCGVHLLLRAFVVDVFLRPSWLVIQDLNSSSMHWSGSLTMALRVRPAKDIRERMTSQQHIT
jgi:hypothetical protein